MKIFQTILDTELLEKKIQNSREKCFRYTFSHRGNANLCYCDPAIFKMIFPSLTRHSQGEKGPEKKLIYAWASLLRSRNDPLLSRFDKQL